MINDRKDFLRGTLFGIYIGCIVLFFFWEIIFNYILNCVIPLLQSFSGFFITFFSTMFGSFLAWLIALWQFANQKNIDKQKEKQCFKSYLECILIELYDNMFILEEIYKTLFPETNPDIELIEWAKLATTPISELAFLNLINSGIQINLSKKQLTDLFNSYRQIRYSKSLINEATLAFNILSRKKATEEGLKSHFDSIKNNIKDTITDLKETLSIIAEVLNLDLNNFVQKKTTP